MSMENELLLPLVVLDEGYPMRQHGHFVAKQDARDVVAKPTTQIIQNAFLKSVYIAMNFDSLKGHFVKLGCLRNVYEAHGGINRYIVGFCQNPLKSVGGFPLTSGSSHSELACSSRFTEWTPNGNNYYFNYLILRDSGYTGAFQSRSQLPKCKHLSEPKDKGRIKTEV